MLPNTMPPNTEPLPSTQDKLATLCYWRNIELFLPFDLDAAIDEKKNSKARNLIILRKDKPCPMPWEARDEYELDPEKEYAFDYFVAPFLKSEVIRLLQAPFPGIAREVPPDTREFLGLSCVARLSLNDKGLILEGEKSVSTLPWALASITNTQPLRIDAFDTYCEKVDTARKVALIEECEEQQARKLGEGLHFSSLEIVARAYMQGMNITFYPDEMFGVLLLYPIRKRIFPKENEKKIGEANGVEEREEEEHLSISRDSTISQVLRKKRKCDILNSFYLRDLERVHSSLAHEDDTLADTYLSAPSRELSRKDIFREEGKHLAEHWGSQQFLPRGRWPAPCTHHQSFEQRVAIQKYLHDKSDIHGVNGPPGTGKTALVRDVVAEILVRRACALARLEKPADAFQSQSFLSVDFGKKNYAYRVLRKEISGHEILVCSNNNAAVENISRELPKRGALGSEYADVFYLPELAHMYEHVFQEQAKHTTEEQKESLLWGMPSVALGNAKNRRTFRRAAFLRYDDESTKERDKRLEAGQMLTFLEWRKRASTRGVSFAKAKKKFLDAYHACDSHIRQRGSSGESENGRAWQENKEHENTLRTQVFLQALELHESWLREVPQFESECYALSQLLQNPSVPDAKDAQALWQLFFMIVPVVSSTLASVERMLGSLEAASLGHIIIDEAGQATPQSVLGIIHRAKRVLCLGDQRQLRPVVLTPDTLDRHFAQEVPIHVRELASVLRSSAQSVVDAGAELGTFIGKSQEIVQEQHDTQVPSTHEHINRLWISLPLCVHRRCANPMFCLANEIAYSGLMESKVPNVEDHPVLGKSRWIQTSGESTHKQWVPEQGRQVLDMVEQLLEMHPDLPDIFFISPFREVRARLSGLLSTNLRKRGCSREFLQNVRKRIGTVHSFQGKEADIVVFVLGCDHNTGRAADWAGEEPNLLNVAITRAKKYLYVIGDVNVWHNRGYFSDLEKGLREWGRNSINTKD